jgi:hypothetical protein
MRNGRNMNFKGVWDNITFKGYVVDTQNIKSLELSMAFWMNPGEDANDKSKTLYRRAKKLIANNKKDYFSENMISINDTPFETSKGKIYVKYIFNLYLKNKMELQPIYTDLIPLCDKLHKEVFKDAEITKKK